MQSMTLRARLLLCSSLFSLAGQVIAPSVFAATLPGTNDLNTKTPVKHVIVIYGENRSFDHLFGTYTSPSGDHVENMLSEGIVNEDGTPGPNFSQAAQYKATATGTYSVTPAKTTVYETLPPPLAGGAQFANDAAAPPFATIQEAASADYGLLPQDLRLLTTGATGLVPNTIDTRISNVNALPSGPFPLSPYDAYAASPVHRYYQARQQADCDASKATPVKPSGCQNDLYPWVEVTVGAGSNGEPQPGGFNDTTTGEGATAMGFYNVVRGDMAYFRQLADDYTISDNFHQPGMGGTGLNSILAGFADGIWYTDGKGHAATPPANQIENPDAQPGTNNYYIQDGYGAATGGGSYSACADITQPGVGSVVSYLNALPKPVASNCEAGHYYLLNNENPGYYGDGSVDTADTFTIPPVPTNSIADVLLSGAVSVRWYGEGYNEYVQDPNDPTNVYCNICNPFQYQTSIMANQTVRAQVLQDTSDFYTSLQAGILPAVSFVKPGALNDGHPVSSKFSVFEAYVRKIITELRQQPELWASTAVFITVDEAGGYWDSGYIQPVDFFGDGPRIPLIVVSPFTLGGRVSHEYGDHISILKFIEANWGLPKISGRSRDNLPNPEQSGANPYVPTNGPALGDLMSMFQH